MVSGISSTNSITVYPLFFVRRHKHTRKGRVDVFSVNGGSFIQAAVSFSFRDIKDKKPWDSRSGNFFFSEMPPLMRGDGDGPTPPKKGSFLTEAKPVGNPHSNFGCAMIPVHP